MSIILAVQNVGMKNTWNCTYDYYLGYEARFEDIIVACEVE